MHMRGGGGGGDSVGGEKGQGGEGRECNCPGVFKKKVKAYFSSLGSHTAIM